MQGWRPQELRCRTERRAGFSLVELLIVIVIIGVLVAMAVPRLSINAMRSDAGVRSARGTLQLAQRIAVSRQSPVIVIVDAANRRMRVHEDTDADNAVDDTERVRTIPLEDGVVFANPTTGIFGGVAGSVVGTNLRDVDGLPSVTFRRDGSASSDVELYLASQPADAVTYRAVQITPASGRVEVWRRTDGGWTRMRP